MIDEPCETSSSYGQPEPQCAMQDTKESDLVSLEKKSDKTLRNIKEVKFRLVKLLNNVRRVDTCEDDCVKEVSVQPKNRIISIFNCFAYIDSENEEMNAIICDLEDILK